MKSESICKIIEEYVEDNYLLEDIGKIIVYDIFKMKNNLYLSHYNIILPEKVVNEVKKEFIKSLRKELLSKKVDYYVDNPYFVYEKFISKMEKSMKNQSYINNSIEGLLYQKIKNLKPERRLFETIANIFYAGSLKYISDENVNQERDYLAKEYNYILLELRNEK
ncbi:MAG: hypothetical protein QXS41_00160 [Candidatus Woesearchaeota archaeon]